MFKVPQLPLRLEKQLYDPLASHNQFYKHVFCKIPEDIFSPLCCADNGRPDAAYRDKNGEEVRGYTHNITETCDDEDKAKTRNGKEIQKPKLIVNVLVEPSLHAQHTERCSTSRAWKLH